MTDLISRQDAIDAIFIGQSVDDAKRAIRDIATQSRPCSKTLRDEFAAFAGEPPSAFVTAYRESVPMGRIRYTYGNPDNDGSARRHDLKVIAEYQANMRAAWAFEFADAMMKVRKND